MPAPTTKAGRILARDSAIREAYTVVPSHIRVDVLQNFVGWVYAQGHHIPRTQHEVAALGLVLETFLREQRTEGWIEDFYRLTRARREGFWRAEHWWKAYRTLKRGLPMQTSKDSWAVCRGA